MVWKLERTGEARVPRGALFNTARTLRGRATGVIGADMTVVGDLHSDGALRVDGEVGGDIVARSVIIGETGYVEGEVWAEEVHVAGAFDGRIEAYTVSIARGARVSGTVTHHALAIEPGAKVDAYRPWRPMGYLEARRKW